MKSRSVFLIILLINPKRSMLIATIPQKRRFRLTVIAHIKQCNDARTRVCADGRTDMVDQEAFIAETVFDEISNILCIFDAVAVADENDVILVTPAADLFLHGIHESNQRLFASSHFGERNQMSLIIHMKKWF